MSTWEWHHFFHRVIWKWLVEVDNGIHPCLQIQSNLIQYMVVDSLKVVHNFYVRRSKFSFRQTIGNLQKIEATVSDSLSIFLDFLNLMKLLKWIDTFEWKWQVSIIDFYHLRYMAAVVVWMNSVGSRPKLYTKTKEWIFK